MTFEERFEELERVIHVLSGGRVCPGEGIASAKALRQQHDWHVQRIAEVGVAKAKEMKTGSRR